MANKRSGYGKIVQRICESYSEGNNSKSEEKEIQVIFNVIPLLYQVRGGLRSGRRDQRQSYSARSVRVADHHPRWNPHEVACAMWVR